MQVDRHRFFASGKFCVTFRLRLSDQELEVVRAARLHNIKIQLYSGSLVGSTLVTAGLVGAFFAQIGKIRNRWSAAIVRTTGVVFADCIIATLKVYGYFLYLLFRFFFGGRKKLADLLTEKGLTYKVSRIEDLKEAEMFVLTSLAAVHEAMKFAQEGTGVKTFEGDEYRAEISGLNFSGGGETSNAEGASAFGDIIVDVIDSLDDS